MKLDSNKKRILTEDDLEILDERIEEALKVPDQAEDIEKLKEIIEELKRHSHKGIDTSRIYTKDLKDNTNFIKFTSSVPSGEPTYFFQRIQLYVSGTTYRLYVWDSDNSVWRYADLGVTWGLTATKTVRNAAGTGTCTLIFTNGLLVGGTC